MPQVLDQNMDQKKLTLQKRDAMLGSLGDAAAEIVPLTIMHIILRTDPHTFLPQFSQLTTYPWFLAKLKLWFRDMEVDGTAPRRYWNPQPPRRPSVRLGVKRSPGQTPKKPWKMEL